MRRPGATLAALAAAAALAGCGEKSEPDTASADTVIADGDAICADAQEQIAALRAEEQGTPEAAARFTADVIAVYEEEVDGLEGLEAPADLQDELDRYIAAREEALDHLRDGLAAAERGNETGYADAQAAVAQGQVERTELAAAVGFEVCSVPQAPSA